MTKTARPIALAAATLVVAGLSGCMTSYVARSNQSTLAPTPAAIGAGAPEGACVDQMTTPAVLETVTEQILMHPAGLRADGSVQTPAVYRTVTRQRIVHERRDVAFAVPCAAVMTPEFVASVQRALMARGYFAGPVTGLMDPQTTAAIERFQSERHDVPTGTLTLRSAQTLGLVALPREAL